MLRRCLAILLSFTLCFVTGCNTAEKPSLSGHYSMGFGIEDLNIPENSEYPLYISGYKQGVVISGVLDLQQTRAVWIDDGALQIILISVDCIGLGSNTVNEIRKRLTSFCRDTGCDSVNVISTHTHAGIDTLGLWGPTFKDGKNPDFTEILINGAVKAAKEAFDNRSDGTLTYSTIPTQKLQKDSRKPYVYDQNIYELKFVPHNTQKNGIRIFSFAAHAESLRSENSKVSRDYPGAVCDIIKDKTGDDALYIPGAIGGLIMTPVLTKDPFVAEDNLKLTGEKIAEYILNSSEEKSLSPSIQISKVSFEAELSNTVFMYYKFLGILGNESRRTLSGTYMLKTELSVIKLGEFTMVLIPGEIFPELLYGTDKEEDPTALYDIAEEYGIDNLMFVGLANDEIGYIVPPSDYVLHSELPFIKEAKGDHYEETNSLGKNCANEIAKAFKKALENLKSR